MEKQRLSIRYDIDKLSKVVGLTDPDLMDLRSEYKIAKEKKDWDTATKIQQLINLKIAEIKAGSPEKEPSETRSPQIVQIVERPSGQANTIEIPKEIVLKHTTKKGLLDIGSAVSIMSGRPLANDLKGGLMLMDALLGN
jgi:hypothetical protein